MTVNNSFKLWMINTWLTHIEYKKLFFFQIYVTMITKTRLYGKSHWKAIKVHVAKVNITIYTYSSFSISDLTVLKQYLFQNLRYHGNQNVPYIKTTFENISSFISKVDMSNTFKS